ncbi:hypothetical protein GIB67_004453 [Kingdonia uniflora]|uniref:Helitron helicase-like domain-containing protein n=1 Tax=Kingdonia uniflora TaxID=39325 RepID=A0A7J7MRH9_9MAGN|nr:hypothetical protein GIB67_004453 [Kingdonia uniflora]
MQISECHPGYLPMHYVLLFPTGQLGWSVYLKHWNVAANAWYSTKKLSQWEYYCYRLFQRTTEYSPILRGSKLFQQFIVDAWASTEQNRFRYVRLNQNNLRSELYGALTDIVTADLDPNQIGQRVVLPSSHTGSARSMYEIYQDSLPITRFNSHPDIFLTITANPKWPEINNALLPNQSVYDRPDLVARVFELKKKALLKEVDNNRVFGTCVAHVWTIEFQKRGLPHMHALFFLSREDKI